MKSPYTPHIFQQIVGKKVQLISCNDRYTHLLPGTKGVVNYVDDNGTLFINWEDGSSLGLIPGTDKWKYI